MLALIGKYLITAALVVVIAEVSKQNVKWGGLIAALPIMTLLALIWMHLDHQPDAKLASFSYYTFWYVLPTLPLFLIFPALLARFGFWPALLASVLATALIFAACAWALRRYGVNL